MNKINILIKPPQEKLKSLLEYFQSGRYGDAEKLSLSITKEFPEHQFAWKILAAVLKQTGRINESLNIIQKSIQLNPQDSTNHNNLGVILQELNRVDEAQACFGKAIKLQPEYAEAHCNLGLILHVLRNFEEAQRSYKQAIGLKHDYAEAYNGLGNLQREIGKSDEAEASFKKAITLKPDYAEAHRSLGIIQIEFGKSDEAEASFKKAITLKPDYAEAHQSLGSIQIEFGKLEEGMNSYKKAITLKPDYAEAKHLLAALIGQTTKSSPRKYVEDLFNTFAINFDHTLVNKLEYKIPNKIVKIIVAENPNIKLGSVLDLGCGTGLIGDEIKRYCSNLEGIDLSKLMLEKAGAKNIYDKLVYKDILEYLSTEDLNFNYFISSDVFVYVGELSEIFRLIKSRNKLKGKFIFSTEHTNKDRFFLEKSGRYSHSKKYIETLCDKFNYKLSHFETTNLRKDKDKFIIGGLYFLDF